MDPATEKDAVLQAHAQNHAIAALLAALRSSACSFAVTITRMAISRFLPAAAIAETAL